MLSGQADRLLKAGRPLWWVAGLLLCAVLAGIAFVGLERGPKTAVLPSPKPRPSATEVVTREAAAAELLTKLTNGLEDGSRGAVVALAAPGSEAAAKELRDMYASVRRLRVTDLEMRYVDEDAGRLSPKRQRQLQGRGWVADVEMSWRLQGYDTSDSRMEVTLTFVQTPAGAAFVTARGGYGQPAPLWLLGRLAVQRSGRTLVMTADRTELGRFGGLARRAVADVTKVLHRWRGRLVVEVPTSEAQLNRVLGSSAHQYDAIAAVTTTVDGSAVATAPTHVFVNPPVFDPLGKRGSQIVMSHEATHVAMNAATSTMPTWILEGFADYVALAHVPLPVTVTASQILADVRRSGPPRRLPGPKAFDTENTALGASYEAAWLACRLIAQKYGERQLIKFYRRLDDGAGTAAAFQGVLHTSQPAFTRSWRNYLRRLSS